MSDTNESGIDRPRVAFVTGAASGIGRATAVRFGAAGSQVCCFDLQADAAEATAESIRDAGGDAIGVGVDVSDEVGVKSAVATGLDHFGHLDVLANVAGIGRFQLTTEESVEEWDRILSVNLTGTFLMCREALPALVETKGVIVNVASLAGLQAHPYAVAYCASKGGVVMLTKTLALEYAAQGVRVNALCPSGVNTPLLGGFAKPEGANGDLFGRIVPITCQLSEPEEMAAAIDFLASPEMPNMTGTLLVVDGGVSV